MTAVIVSAPGKRKRLWKKRYNEDVEKNRWRSLEVSPNNKAELSDFEILMTVKDDLCYTNNVLR